MAVLSGQRLSPARLNQRTVRARRSITLAVNTGVLQPLTWDFEDFDNASMVSLPSATVTLPVAGLWGFAGYAGVASNSTGFRRLLLELDTSGVYPTIDQRPAVSGDATHMTISGSHVADAGDKIRLAVHQNSGVTLNVLAGAYFTVWLIES